MPSFVSKMGIWKPAQERAYIPPDPEKGRTEGYIYEGEDRAAKAMLAEQGVSQLGMNVREDPEVIQRARNLGMTVDEFLHLNEPVSAEAKAHEDAKSTRVNKHEDPVRKPGVKHQGGRAPERPESEGGGFGSPPEMGDVKK